MSQHNPPFSLMAELEKLSNEQGWELLDEMTPHIPPGALLCYAPGGGKGGLVLLQPGFELGKKISSMQSKTHYVSAAAMVDKIHYGGKKVAKLVDDAVNKAKPS